MKYSKKIFALLLERAKGERSWRVFAEDCDISSVQMRKLACCEQENPPRRKLLLKLGAHSENGITAEDFLTAAGTDEEKLSAEDKALLSTVSALRPKDRRLLEDYAAFLLSRSGEDD